MPLPSRNSALDRIEQQVKSDKLWDLTHISTLMCGMAVIFTSFCVYLISDFVNCDSNSPYGQASFSALYTFALCAHLWIYSNILHSAVRDFEAPRYLSPQGRQRRRLRIPVLLAIVASGQVLAATAFGLSAYRTFMAPLGLLALVPIVATAAAISCFAAGMANTLLALSVHRSGKSTDGSLDFADKKDTKNHHPTEDPISIYDIDFTNLPTFDKQWLAVHILAIGAIISAAATSSAFLWHMPCSDSSRKDLFKLSEECFNMPFLLANMGRFVLLLWLPRVGRRVEDRNQSRIMVLLTQALFFIVAVILGITTYQAPSSNYILVIVKSQTAVASIACFLCGVYDVALMFKTNFDYTAREATNVEEGGGAYQSGGKGDEKQRPF